LLVSQHRWPLSLHRCHAAARHRRGRVNRGKPRLRGATTYAAVITSFLVRGDGRVAACGDARRVATRWAPRRGRRVWLPSAGTLPGRQRLRRSNRSLPTIVRLAVERTEVFCFSVHSVSLVAAAGFFFGVDSARSLVW